MSVIFDIIQIFYYKMRSTSFFMNLSEYTSGFYAEVSRFAFKFMSFLVACSTPVELEFGQVEKT